MDCCGDSCIDIASIRLHKARFLGRNTGSGNRNYTSAVFETLAQVRDVDTANCFRRASELAEATGFVASDTEAGLPSTGRNSSASSMATPPRALLTPLAPILLAWFSR